MRDESKGRPKFYHNFALVGKVVNDVSCVVQFPDSVAARQLELGV